MRIALLSEKYTPDPGGLAISTARLARLLAGAGHHVEVICPSAALAPGQAEAGAQAGLTVVRFGAQRKPEDTLADWFDRLVASHQARPLDLVHGYFVHQGGFVAAYGGRYLGVPAVVSARGNDLDRAIFEPGKAAHGLYALAHAAAVTANSRDLARKAHALAPGRVVTLIPNGVDAALFAPGARSPDLADQFALDGCAVAGFVGEARAKKGLAPLLLAFCEVAQRRPACLLLIGGVRKDDRDTVRVFQKQNPHLRVLLVPPVHPAALPAYYRLLDVLVLPSLHDGLPNALLEGMACGCAVVAARAGGIPDAVRDGENGRLVPPGDEQALAAALDALLDDDAERARLGANARATVLGEFTLEQELALTLQVYEAVIGQA